MLEPRRSVLTSLRSETKLWDRGGVPWQFRITVDAHNDAVIKPINRRPEEGRREGSPFHNTCKAREEASSLFYTAIVGAEREAETVDGGGG